MSAIPGQIASTMDGTTGHDESPSSPINTSTEPASDAYDEGDPEDKASRPSRSLALHTPRRWRVLISATILLSHGLFLWGQLGVLWGQQISIGIDVDAEADVGPVDKQVGRDDSSVFPTLDWSYGSMLEELWIYSKVTYFFLLIFSAIWPHLKLLLLHLYYYAPVPSRPRTSAIYWLDTIGKMSLADVCATVMLFLILDIQTTVDVGKLASDASSLLGHIVSETNMSSGLLSNATQGLLLETAQNKTYEEVVSLSDSIFENGDYTLYQPLLETGCSEFYNNGESCANTTFYEPVNLNSLTQIMTKCLRIRGDKCYQCECIVNNAIYNKVIPSELVEDEVDDLVSMLFAKLLAAVEPGDISSWFSVTGDVTARMLVLIYPAFLGFTVAVILSITASILVTYADEEANRKKFLEVSSLGEALLVNGCETDSRTLLFSQESKVTKTIAIVSGLGIVPLVYFALYMDMFSLVKAGVFPEILSQTSDGAEVVYSVAAIVESIKSNVAFAALFGFFMLAMPLLRALLLAFATLIPLKPSWQVRLVSLSNYSGSFIGWEPFFVCLFILIFELPSMTSSIIPEDTCDTIEETRAFSWIINRFGLDQEYCFVLYFRIFPMATLLFCAWIYLTLFNAAAWRTVVRRYDPFGTQEALEDTGGPYCNCKQCCYFGYCRKKQ